MENENAIIKTGPNNNDRRVRILKKSKSSMGFFMRQQPPLKSISKRIIKKTKSQCPFFLNSYKRHLKLSSTPEVNVNNTPNIVTTASNNNNNPSQVTHIPYNMPRFLKYRSLTALNNDFSEYEKAESMAEEQRKAAEKKAESNKAQSMAEHSPGLFARFTPTRFRLRSKGPVHSEENSISNKKDNFSNNSPSTKSSIRLRRKTTIVLPSSSSGGSDSSPKNNQIELPIRENCHNHEIQEEEESDLHMLSALAKCIQDMEIEAETDAYIQANAFGCG